MASLCAEIVRAIDRMYAAEGPDEPDLGLNVTYVTARHSLQRLAAAKDWELPASVAESIRARLGVIASAKDPERLERELLSFPAWALRNLDRRRVPRHAVHSSVPQRREGDRLRLVTTTVVTAHLGRSGAS